MAYNWQQFKNGLFGFSYDYEELLTKLREDVAIVETTRITDQFEITYTKVNLYEKTKNIVSRTQLTFWKKWKQ